MISEDSILQANHWQEIETFNCERSPNAGFAGIGVVSTYWIIHLFNYLPVRRESVPLIYLGQVNLFKSIQ